MTSPITAAALLLADKRVAVTLWAKAHKSEWSKYIEYFSSSGYENLYTEKSY